jgi:hypothetical protein
MGNKRWFGRDESRDSGREEKGVIRERCRRDKSRDSRREKKG